MTSALAASGVTRRVERVFVATLGCIGAVGTIACMLLPEPIVASVITVPAAADGADQTVPCWVDGALVQRVWARETHEPVPVAQSIGVLTESELALSAIEEGMAMSTHGQSRFREAMWGAARVLTFVQLRLRLLSTLAAVVSLPICLGLLFRSADRARVLALPGLVLLWLLGAGNVVLALFACLLPEGGMAAVRTLPFHVALLSFILAATLASRRLRTGSSA